jgi:hypothetical protein
MRRHVTSAAVAGLVALWAGVAQAGVTVGASGPTLAAVTQVAGHRLPAALARGSWQAAGRGQWRLVERSAAPLGGSTSVSASWTTASRAARAGQVIFRTDWAEQEQSAVGGYAASQRVRVCPTGHACSRWFRQAPPSNSQPILGRLFTVSVVGQATLLIWQGSPATVKVQWQYGQQQRNGDIATTDLTVADH